MYRIVRCRPITKLEIVLLVDHMADLTNDIAERLGTES